MIWLNARDIDPAGVEIAMSGLYSVWLWAPDDARATITINGNDFAVSPSESPKHAYTWRKADTANLKAGAVQLSLSENVAAIAMSISETFDPSVAMRDMSVFTEPVSANDHRIYATRHTDTVYTMPGYTSLEEWTTVTAKIRKRMLLACGLWPMPENPPLLRFDVSNLEIGAMMAPRRLSVFHAAPSFEAAVVDRYKAVGAEASVHVRQDALSTETLLSALDVP